MHKVGWFLFGLFFTTILTFGIIAVLFSLGMLQDVFAEKYTDNFFATVKGEYNVKNGVFDFSGIGRYGTATTEIQGIVMIKEWMINDSSIPLCRHAFTQSFPVNFDNVKNNNANMILYGKMCNANLNSTWKIFYGKYYIIDGTVGNAENITGQGIIELLINTSTGKTIGKINGNLILYT